MINHTTPSLNVANFSDSDLISLEFVKFQSSYSSFGNIVNWII